VKSLNELMKTHREDTQSKYPELNDFTKEEIWCNSGAGKLYLILRLAKALDLEDGRLYFEEQTFLTDPGGGYFKMSGAETRELEIRQI
jgi:hypothetical protein